CGRCSSKPRATPSGAPANPPNRPIWPSETCVRNGRGFFAYISLVLRTGRRRAVRGEYVSTEKYLVVIGLSEEDTAHLRLMLRAVAGQLEHKWRWGTEDNADLFVVDPSDMSGQITRNRAFSSGRRCAVVGNEELRNGESRLERPFKSD